jgi:molybdopterin synthase sulfur carrier subunit
MKVTVRYFASIREALGSSESVSLEPGATVGAVRDELIARGGAYAVVLARQRVLRTALNQVLCDEAAVVSTGAELAFFPPVTGG